ncbi:hypothetical protein H072_10368 [Dactylellina haptotyla CBS 200.50]|uniref:non-specific serine/threonine protein kinase n=1 Tax=Dactylellina haptotyla (strain CBS 200.50) TaxID=1284197 RepID=S7ZZP5_DACHA|nr:hypothetical protein H072_10368 [Dactylellina haptotyla CBS 200.50]
MYSLVPRITSSPPRTPSPISQAGNESRFNFIAQGEYVDNYRPGGYHPVHLGDLFCNDRYKVIRKLGFGAFSTVWLVHDTIFSGFAALKIKQAHNSVDDQELIMLIHLQNSKLLDPSKEHVIRLQDHFYHEGPNGRHLCLVFELLGDNIYEVLEDYSMEMTGNGQELSKFPKSVAKKIIKDLLLGLNWLHINKVIHGDLQPGNFLSSMKGVSSLELEDLETDADSAKVDVTRIDGKPDKWAPNYIVVPQGSPIEADEWPFFPVKLSDLGAGYFAPQPPTTEKIITPIALQSPELILRSCLLDTFVDIWSFGCMLFEMLVGERLLPVWPTGIEENDADACLLAMHHVLGPLPEEIKEKWPRWKDYFGESSDIPYNLLVEGHASLLEPIRDMETMIRDTVSAGNGLDEEEGKALLSLLRGMLNYDPKERPSASEILKSALWDEMAVEE